MSMHSNISFKYSSYPKTRIIYYEKMGMIINNEPAYVDWSSPNNDLTNIKAINNFVNVSKGRKPKKINSLIDYNHSKVNKHQIHRNSRRKKQIKRLEKEHKKYKGVFQILDSGPKQDINQMIAIIAKQKRLEARQMKKYKSVSVIQKNQKQLILKQTQRKR